MRENNLLKLMGAKGGGSTTELNSDFEYDISVNRNRKKTDDKKIYDKIFMQYKKLMKNE